MSEPSGALDVKTGVGQSIPGPVQALRARFKQISNMEVVDAFPQISEIPGKQS